MPVSDQGVFHERYKIIPRVLIFATRGEEILLLKGHRKKRLWANLYNGIGGHVEQGEDILTAARREFLEETGVNLINEYLCAIVTIDAGDKVGIGMYVFIGETATGKLTESREGKLEWHPIKKIASLPLVEDLPKLLPKILEVGSEDQPVYAQYTYNENDELEMQFSK